MDLYVILSGILFGGIGTAAFIYGRRQALWKPMVIGAALVAETYFLKSVPLIWAVGSALAVSLWFFRD